MHIHILQKNHRKQMVQDCRKSLKRLWDRLTGKPMKFHCLTLEELVVLESILTRMDYMSNADEQVNPSAQNTLLARLNASTPERQHATGQDQFELDIPEELW